MAVSGRRLAAIMFTDMVGYTALTQADESHALAVLERHHRLLRPIFPQFHGKEIKTMGDSFLVEFESALDATRCAVEIQRFLREYNASNPEAWKIRVRIGVHLGDVTHTGDDVLGDAVNIASRIEPLAEPEGVCLSGQVFDQVRGRLTVPIERLGPRDLKNVQFPVEVYKVGPLSTAPTAPTTAEDRPRRLAVLPFANMSPDAKDDYFAEGLTEELIAELSRAPPLRVIARTSVMRFKGTTHGVREIGRELGVRTVLEGSVRKAGNRIRITAQLIDARSEEHLWSDMFDRELDDIFAIQSEIAKSVTKALHFTLVPPTGEVKPPTQDLRAYGLYLKGRALWNKRTHPDVLAALACFEEARTTDPAYAQAYSGIADCLSILGDRGKMPWSEAGPSAVAAARKAVELDTTLASAHASLGLVLLRQHEWEACENEFKTAIALNPGYAMAHLWYYLLLMDLGRPEEARAELSLAEEADPLSPTVLSHAGYVAWLSGNDPEALRRWKRALELDPGLDIANLYQMEFYCTKSRLDEALAAFRTFESHHAGNLSTNPQYGFFCGMLGMRREAEDWVENLLARSKTSYVHPMSVAWTYAALGETDRFFEWLFRAADDLYSGVFALLTNPVFEKVRLDPRFREYLRQCHLAE